MIESQPMHSQHATKCELAIEVLRSSGRLRLRVNGWSMLPSVWPGDTLFVERTSGDRVVEGDIVLFSRDRRLFAHRVVGRTVESARILTRGDAMRIPDHPVHESELIGRVVALRRNRKFILPRKTLTMWELSIAALVCRSASVARVIVGIYVFFQSQSVQQA